VWHRPALPWFGLPRCIHAAAQERGKDVKRHWTAAVLKSRYPALFCSDAGHFGSIPPVFLFPWCRVHLKLPALWVATMEDPMNKKVVHEQDVEDGQVAQVDDSSSLGKGDILQREHVNPILNAKMHLINNAMYTFPPYYLPKPLLTDSQR
jgi:hypothetical protein